MSPEVQAAFTSIEKGIGRIVVRLLEVRRLLSEMVARNEPTDDLEHELAELTSYFRQLIKRFYDLIGDEP